jgi:hypothetical protein
MRIQTCPLPASLTTIPDLSCAQSFGQTQKMAFWRKGNSIVTIILAQTLLTWTTLKAAVDSTKVVITPFLSGVDTEPGKAKEYGSGNEVRNGIPIVMRNEPTKVTAKLYEYSADIITALKALVGEQLEVLLFNEVGWIGCGKSGVRVVGLPIQSLNISDLKLGGFDAPDYYEMTFSFPENWSNNFLIVDPTANFNSLDL